MISHILIFTEDSSIVESVKVALKSIKTEIDAKVTMAKDRVEMFQVIEDTKVDIVIAESGKINADDEKKLPDIPILLLCDEFDNINELNKNKDIRTSYITQPVTPEALSQKIEKITSTIEEEEGEILFLKPDSELDDNENVLEFEPEFEVVTEEEIITEVDPDEEKEELNSYVAIQAIVEKILNESTSKIIEEQFNEFVKKSAQQMINPIVEKIVREVVPQIAERLIKIEIEKIKHGQK